MSKPEKSQTAQSATTTPHSNFDHLPQNDDAEESILGSLLIEGSSDDTTAISGLSSFLKPAHFRRIEHRLVYEAILRLYAQGKPADQITVAQELGLMNKLGEVGGGAHLSQLIERTPTSIHAIHYGKIIKDKAIQRQIIQVSGEVAKIAQEGKEDDAAKTLERCIGLYEEIWTEVGQQPLRITDLVKLGEDPPKYYLKVNGHTIKVDTDTLLTYRYFRAKVCEICDFLPPPMKEAEWSAMVNRLLQGITHEEAPAEAGDEYTVWQAAVTTIKDQACVTTIEEFNVGKPIEKGDYLYIKGAPFLTMVRQRLKTNHLTPIGFWSNMKEHGFKSANLRIGADVVRAFKVPLAALEETPGEESDELPLL